MTCMFVGMFVGVFAAFRVAAVPSVDRAMLQTGLC